MSEMVCIGTYSSREEAEFAKGLLGEADIRAMVSADDCGGMRSHLAFTAGGVQLLVLSEHAGRAAEVLSLGQETEFISREERAVATAPAGPNEGGESGACLSCGARMREEDETCPGCGWSYESGGAESGLA